MTKRKNSKGVDLKPFLLYFGIVLFVFTTFLGYFFIPSEKGLLPISVFALIAGIIYENKRLTQKWSTVFYVTLFAYVLSYLSFLPGRNESIYNLENHIRYWPYSFIFIYVILAIAFNKEKLTPKLTEGITLLQSIAFIYWVIDFGFNNLHNIIVIVLVAIGFILTVFSIFNAFSYFTLSKISRFTLSIWSSIVMLLFAVENIYNVYQNEQIESTSNLTQGLFIGLQYFLLGVCSIYIVHNFMMLVSFLPGKGTFFNKQYFKDVKELKEEHILRFSEMQVRKLQSLFCLIFLGAIFSLNYYYRILPRNVAIWIVFVIFPYILFTYDYLIEHKKTTANSC